MNVIEKFTAFYSNLESMQINELKTIYSSNVTFIDPIAHHCGLSAVEFYFSRLLRNAKRCEFDITDVNDTGNDVIFVEWQMRYSTKGAQKNKVITVDGITHLKVEDNFIVYQRDYYDLGEMVYENIPILGRLVKRIKKSLK